MKFHKIEMVGKFILQKINGLPEFDFARDEARLVYNLEDGKVYQGNNEQWALLAGNIPEGTPSDDPEQGAIIYYNGEIYYGTGTEWLKLALAGDIPQGDITTDTPIEGQMIYYNNIVYYSDGVKWIPIAIRGEIPQGDITTEPPYISKILYYNDKLYYADGTQWLEIALAGNIPEGDTSIDDPTIPGQTIYQDGNFYYSDGTQWVMILNDTEMHDRNNHSDIDQVLLTSSDVSFNKVNISGTDYTSSVRETTINTSDPIGGKDGDVWYKI